jgi:hypothetical protein
MARATRSEEELPQRLYVIVGEPSREHEAPSYSTNPADYGLDVFDKPVTEAEFEREYKHKVKAFLDRDDAISFAYHCNLVGVLCPVYDRVGDEWVYNSEETGKVADDIN